MAEERESVVLISKNDFNELGFMLYKEPKKMTRTEAIERIVKAIAIKYFEGVFSCENEEIEEYAEAALNALLGEK